MKLTGDELGENMHGGVCGEAFDEAFTNLSGKNVPDQIKIHVPKELAKTLSASCYNKADDVTIKNLSSVSKQRTVNLDLTELLGPVKEEYPARNAASNLFTKQ